MEDIHALLRMAAGQPLALDRPYLFIDSCLPRSSIELLDLVRILTRDPFLAAARMTGLFLARAAVVLALGVQVDADALHAWIPRRHHVQLRVVLLRLIR